MPDESLPAPYGRACSNCARAKCRCMLRPAGGRCERCHRLNKDCSPAATVRKKSSRKGASRTAQLEEKLDDLVTLLRSSTARSGLAAASLLEAAGGGGDADAAGTRTAEALLRLGQASHQHHAGGGDSPSDTDGLIPTPATTTTPHVQHTPDSVDQHPNDDVSPFEAEECLEHFRVQKCKYFPFIFLPATVTAAELRRDRPYLFLAMLAASVKSASRQAAIGARLRRLYADKLIVEHERSLDLMLSLICFLGWGHFHLGPHPFLSMYSHMLVALAHDLSLERPPPIEGDSHPMACVKSHGFTVKLQVSPIRSMEERRAIVSAYFITSSCSTFLRKPTPMRWTPHMQDCLRILDETNESPLDRILVSYIRLKLISDECPKPATLFCDPRDRLDKTPIVQEFEQKALSSRVQAQRRSFPADLPEDIAQLLHLHALHTELEIIEPILFSSPPRSTSSAPDMHRIQTLSWGLEMAQEWFDSILSTPPGDFFLMSMPNFTQLSHKILVLYRLSTLEDPDFDLALVRRSFNTPELLDRLTAHYASVPAAAGLISDRPDGDLFHRVTRAMTAMKISWEPKFAAALSASTGRQPESADSGAGDGTGGGGAAAGAAGGGESALDTLDSLMVDGQMGFDLSGDGMANWFTDIFSTWELPDARMAQ